MTRRIAGPFEAHLRDAIALNRERAPRYAALSHGASMSISRSLIAAEWLLLPVARWFDRRAAPYERAGIPLMQDCFVPMSDVPPFMASRPWPPAASPPAPATPSRSRRRIRSAFRNGSFAAAADAVEDELRVLAAAPGHAMLRHLLESARRIATVAPAHVSAAEVQGLPSPAPLLGRLLLLHLLGLETAMRLDRRAHVLQRQGIPILEQDLPPIPARPG